jgi:hypothetical protein
MRLELSDVMRAGFLLGLLFSPVNGRDIFQRKERNHNNHCCEDMIA